MRISPKSMDLLRDYGWPGNVRQLRNVIERLVITCHEAVIEVKHLPDFLCEHDRNATTFTVRPGTPLSDVEKQLIRQTLNHVTSNREDAAKALGISRRALQYKLKQYGLVDKRGSDPAEG
jgi:transcriptional regulator with PAS, ATPase and Fis domain